MTEQKIIITLNDTNSKQFTLGVDFEPKIGTKGDFMERDHAAKRLQIVAAAICDIITKKLPDILRVSNDH